MMASPTQVIFYFDLCLKPSKDNLHFNIANHVKTHIGLPVTQLIEKRPVVVVVVLVISKK